MDSNYFQFFLHFSRKERVGILCTVAVLFLLYALPEVIYEQPLLHDHADSDTGFTIERYMVSQRDVERQAAGWPIKKKSESYDTVQRTLFPFDPNTLDSAGFIRLGLRTSTIRTLIKYRSKGGRFHRAEDITKLYGLTPAEKQRLLPFVRIETNSPKDKPDKREWTRAYGERTFVIDINRADSAQWDALPGIGPVLTSRILKYRDRLGGFFSVEQVRETYGITDSVFANIRPSLQAGDLPVRVLRVNQDTEEELSKHPYVGKVLAREIIAYRNMHGAFRDTAGLLQLFSRSAADIRRLFPYAKFGEINNANIR